MTNKYLPHSYEASFELFQIPALALTNGLIPHNRPPAPKTLSGIEPHRGFDSSRPRPDRAAHQTVDSRSSPGPPVILVDASRSSNPPHLDASFSRSLAPDRDRPGPTSGREGMDGNLWGEKPRSRLVYMESTISPLVMESTWSLQYGYESGVYHHQSPHQSVQTLQGACSRCPMGALKVRMLEESDSTWTSRSSAPWRALSERLGRER